jgi:hypothetical protein
MGLVQLLRAVNIFTAGIAAGAQLFVLLTIVPARKHWPPKVGAQVHQTALTHPAERYLRPTNMVSVITGVLLMLLQRNHETLPGMLNILGIGAGVVNGIISARWEWPINDEINTWSMDAPIPDTYTELRDTWDRHHLQRTILTLTALFSFALAGVARQRD